MEKLENLALLFLNLILIFRALKLSSGASGWTELLNIACRNLLQDWIIQYFLHTCFNPLCTIKTEIWSWRMGVVTFFLHIAFSFWVPQNNLWSQFSTPFCIFPPLKSKYNSWWNVAAVWVAVQLQCFMFFNTKKIAVVFNRMNFITWNYSLDKVSGTFVGNLSKVLTDPARLEFTVLDNDSPSVCLTSWAIRM